MTDARRVGDLRDWLLPYVVRGRVDIESWMTFWLAELREGPSEGGAEPLGRERAVEPSVELGLRCGHTAIRARP